jgi:hypothetical protein
VDIFVGVVGAGAQIVMLVDSSIDSDLANPPATLGNCVVP